MEVPKSIAKKLERTGGLKSIRARMPSDGDMRAMSMAHYALSDPVRLRILAALRIQPLCVCLIKKIMRMSDSKLSYHLSILKTAGMIDEKRQKNWLIYKITRLGKNMFRI